MSFLTMQTQIKSSRDTTGRLQTTDTSCVELKGAMGSDHLHIPEMPQPEMEEEQSRG